ncbi:MAG: acyltransferase, partial [Planctomycetota bacterium]|nr:acyltransferase [Planctomycetota bacterium]
MARIQYRPEIDGLRAIAVLAVILFHLDIGLSGGFLGVDVFFVISGFLITSIIIADLKTNSFSLKKFWMKRLRRLAPASFVMLIGTLLVGWFFFLPAELISLGKSQLAQVVLFANYHFAYRVDYFDPIAGLNPLLHAWSLAVEEHFYLLFPIILCVLFKRGMRSIWLSLSTLLVLSLAYSIWQVGHKPELAFYLLPSRAWELLIGCCLACCSGSIRESSRARRFKSFISYVSGTALLFCFWSYDQSTAFPGLNAVIPCLATAGLIYGTQSTNLVTSFLKLRVMVGIGLISYSLYLWHWPVIVFTKLTYASEFTASLTVILVFVCFLLAFLSWRFIEQPFRKRIW